jgi:SPP1 gp7 family putative phage head morphogenesis protein
MSIPEVFFRETIDINRYSNAVSVDLVRTYNDVILLAARKLNAINIRQAKAGEGVVIAPQTKKRLRAIIAQSKTSLDKWSRASSKKMIKEIEGLAKVQAGFIEGELKKAVKSGNIPINSVAVSSKYAESFVTTDPTKVNIFTSKQFTEDDFKKFGSGKFELTARQGAMQTLPNGETVEKAFRGIATRQQEGLARTIRQGVFSGESTQQIASRMIGRLEFGQRGSVRQIAQAGGEMTKLANHQIQTIVRTSVNQVQNQASQAVYAANSKVAPKYEYVATLDSRTSPICKRLDGRKFEYNKGPTPPQHFNCRSTTVPVVDYAGLKKQKGFEDLTPPPKGKVVTRPTGEGTGRVPQDTQYGDWLLGQDKKLKVKTLGNEQKVRYFERLAKKEGSGQKAIRKMVREDGSERSLKDLERLYGKPSAIKPKAKPKPKVKTLTNTKPTTDSWGATSDYKEAIRRGESMTKGRFDKTKSLTKDYKKAFEEFQDARESYYTYDFDSAYTGGISYNDAITVYKAENAKRKALWKAKKEVLEKIETRGAKEMAVLRKELLKTNISDKTIKESLDKIPFTNQTKALQLGVRKEIEEFAKMFNGGGVTVKQARLSDGGQLTKVKLGTSRAYNELGEILVPFGDPTSVSRTLKAKQTIFHEVGHSLEKITKDNLDIAVGWRTSRVTSNIPTKAKTKVKRAWTLKEKVLPDEFITPYVGRPYVRLGADRATEVVSMGVEHFATPELMFRLYSVDPDHFHMILSLTRNTY